MNIVISNVHLYTEVPRSAKMPSFRSWMPESSATDGNLQVAQVLD
ncbi:MAG: hypothetical protein WCI11_04440 [Candidatus Methylumidiphilus sp.]|nr:hypothetical protein [Pseudomonadota bacterium]